MPPYWNNVIKAYALSKNNAREAILAFQSMRRCEAVPNEYTFPFLFKACSSFSGLNEGRQIHAHVFKHGLCSNLYVQNTMIHLYGSFKKILDACKVFDEMSLRSVVSWNSVIAACVDCCWFDEAIGYFFKMRESGYWMDETTMVILLSACGEVGNLSRGRWVHSQVIVNGMVVNVQLGTSMVDMYGKCGAVDYARLVFDRMSFRSVWTWSAMILGLAQHGFAAEALEYFSQMQLFKVTPNYVTFLGVLCACSHAGLVEEGKRCLHDMEHVYKIKPQMAHYGAMVDIFGRAGELEEAYAFILRMRVKPDATIWRTLLSACTIHDVNDFSGIAEKVSRMLFELEPRRCGNLVMVANRHAEVGSWEKAEQIRKKMRKRRFKKRAGESWLEVGGFMTKFFSGYDSQAVCEETLLLLERLILHMKMVSHEN
ncbi:hypothetical protein Leryth_025280 [Lithospermum erythrorhizon]|nr:hypothetical protein Leryth_025280 [Lithospermum erythrorhizon]